MREECFSLTEGRGEKIYTKLSEVSRSHVREVD